MKDNFSQKRHENMIFSVCWVKMFFCFFVVFFFLPTNMNYPSVKKAKANLFPKNTNKYKIPGITENDDFYLRKDDIAILD